MREADFLRKLRVTFRGEAEEHLRAISAGLLGIEQAATAEQRKAHIETVFREAHSLKGAARSVNIPEIESACHTLEGIFADWKQDDSAAPGGFDELHAAVDAMTRVVSAMETMEGPGTGRGVAGAAAPPAAGRGSPASHSATSPGANPASAVDSGGHTGTLRLSEEKLDALLMKSEELLAEKLSAAQLAADLRDLARDVASWKRRWALNRRPLRSTDSEVSGAGESGSEAADPGLQFMESMESRLTTLARSAAQGSHALSLLVDSLLADIKDALTLPFASLLEGFPRLVRELSRDRRKEVEFVVCGAELEADRRVLEEIKTPLIHLVRNCIDHGIEPPADRERRGKPRRGTLSIHISQVERNRVQVTVSDDGGGVPLERVREKAVRLGLLSAEEAADRGPSECLTLLFHSGLSTSPIVTDISGRGLGLAIVQEKVQRLGGTVELASAPGAGTEFRLLLPLTLANFRALLVRAGGRTYALPASHVQIVLRARPEDLSTAGGRTTCRHEGRVMALASLEGTLTGGMSGDCGPERVVVLVAGERRMAFSVDEVLGVQEVLVKPLGPQLLRVRNVAGATVLGTGQVVPILHVPDLIASAASAAGDAPAQPPAAGPRSARPSILVVEDSITARSLLRSILESAGYLVRTAVDGAEALGLLRAGRFDVVVSDVEMPRLNGFELTSRIRADARLADLPVILVTALDSPEDRERGVEVGANAYMVKRSFDQSNLLDAVQRLT